jgi:hypothetical protein
MRKQIINIFAIHFTLNETSHLQLLKFIDTLKILSRVCGDYIRRVGLATGFIGSHTVTHNYSVYALQLTTVHYNIAESSHCIFTGCLSSNIAGSVRLQLCNSSLKTAARPEH